MATQNGLNLTLSGSTGTGTFVGATSPTITTPKIAQINDTNGVAELAFTTTASAVNYFTMTNASTANGPGLSVVGSDTNISVQFNTKGTGIYNFASASTTPITIYSGTASQHGTIFSMADTSVSRTVTFPDATGTMLMTGQAISTVPSIAFSSTSGIIGTTTNDSAAALSVGEYVSSVVEGSPVSITTGTATDITSISLTAGDWDVYGNVTASISAGTDFTQFFVWISATSATTPAASLYNITTTLGASVIGIPAPCFRASLSGTTTIYLSCKSVFAGGTLSGKGGIYARRRR